MFCGRMANHISSCTAVNGDTYNLVTMEDIHIRRLTGLYTVDHDIWVWLPFQFQFHCIVISGLFHCVVSRGILSRALDLQEALKETFVILGRLYSQSKQFFNVLKARLLLKEPLWLQLKNCLLESGSLRLYMFQCCFPQGGKSCIVRCRSTSLERRAIFLREESRLFVLFVAARPVWNVVLFSSGRKYFVCLSSHIWTSCLISRRSTNLECRAVFSRENILLFVLFWNFVPFSSGRKLTLFAFDRST